MILLGLGLLLLMWVAIMLYLLFTGQGDTAEFYLSCATIIAITLTIFIIATIVSALNERSRP